MKASILSSIFIIFILSLTSCRFSKPVISIKTPPDSTYNNLPPNVTLESYKAISLLNNRRSTFLVFTAQKDSSTVEIWKRKVISFKNKTGKVYESIYRIVNDTLNEKFKRGSYDYRGKQHPFTFKEIEIVYKNGKKEERRNWVKEEKKKSKIDRFFHME